MVFWEELCVCVGTEQRLGDCKACLIHRTSQCIPQMPLLFPFKLFAKVIPAQLTVNWPLIRNIFKLHSDWKCLNCASWKPINYRLPRTLFSLAIWFPSPWCSLFLLPRLTPVCSFSYLFIWLSFQWREVQGEQLLFIKSSLVDSVRFGVRQR